MEENKKSEAEAKDAEKDKELNTGAEMEESRAEENAAVRAEEKNEMAEAANNSEEAAGNGKKAARGMVSTRNGLYLRTVIGGLILYYAYTILSDMGTASGTSRTILYVFAAVFGIAGIGIVLDSLKRLFKKEYDE